MLVVAVVVVVLVLDGDGGIIDIGSHAGTVYTVHASSFTIDYTSAE